MKRRVLYRKLTTVLLVSVLFAVGYKAGRAEASGHKAYKMPLIEDLSIATSFSKEIRSSAKSFHMTLSYETYEGKPIGYIYKSHNPAFVEGVAKKSSVIMRSFLKRKKITYSECRGYNYNLVVTIVTKSVLQDEERFKTFYRTRYGQENLVGRVLYGYYDSTPEIANNSSMLLTDVGSMNEEILAHELAHYWWDRLCLTSYVSGTSESFAQEFQAYYMSYIRKH